MEIPRAFADDAPTGFKPLDLSAALRTGHAATTPFMAACYARVRKAERLTYSFAAGAETKAA